MRPVIIVRLTNPLTFHFCSNTFIFAWFIRAQRWEGVRNGRLLHIHRYFAMQPKSISRNVIDYQSDNCRDIPMSHIS